MIVTEPFLVPDPPVAVCFNSSSGDLVVHASTRQAPAQPTNLSAMIDFIFGDVKPRPMHVDPRRRAHGPFQPGIVAGGETLECQMTHGPQLIQVMVKGAPPQSTSALASQRQGYGPLCILVRRQRAILERHDLI